MNRTRLNRSLWVSAGIALAAMGAAFQGIDARFSELDGYLRSGLLAEVSRLHAALEADYGRQANSDNYLELVRRRPYIHLVQNDRPSAQAAFKFAAEAAAARRKPDLAARMLMEMSAMFGPDPANKAEVVKLHRQIFSLILEWKDERLLPEVKKLILQAKAAGTLDELARDADRAANSPTIGWRAAILALTVDMSHSALQGDERKAKSTAFRLRGFIEKNGDPATATKAVAEVISSLIQTIDPKAGNTNPSARAFYELAKGWQDGPLLVDAFELEQWHNLRVSAAAAEKQKKDCLSALDAMKLPEFKSRILATDAWLTGRALADSAFSADLLGRLGPLLQDCGYESSSDPFTAGRGYQAQAEWLIATKPTNFAKVAAFNLGLAAEKFGSAKKPEDVRAKDIKGLKETFLRLPPQVRQIVSLLRPLRSVRDQLEKSGDPNAITEWYGFWLDVADQVDFQSAVTLFEEAFISLRTTGGTSLPVGQRPQTAEARRARQAIASLLARAARTANMNGQSAYVSRYFQDLVDLKLSGDSPRDFLEAAKQVFLSGQIFSKDDSNQVLSAAFGGKGTTVDKGWALLLLLDQHLNNVAEMGALRRNLEPANDQYRRDQTKLALERSEGAKRFFAESSNKDGLAFERLVWADHKLRGYWVSPTHAKRMAYEIEFIDPASGTSKTDLNDFTLASIESLLIEARSLAVGLDARVAVECRVAVLHLMRGKPSSAEAQLKPLLTELSTTTDRRLWLAVAELVGRAQYEQKNFAEAGKTLRDLISVVEGLRSDAQALESVKRQVQERYRDSYFRAIDAEIQLGNKEEAFLVLQMTKSRTLLDGIYDRPSYRAKLEDGEVDQSAELRDQLSEKTFQFLVAQVPPSNARGVSELSASNLANDLLTLERRLESWEALMGARNTGTARQGSAPVLNSKQARECLEDNEALVEFGDLSTSFVHYLPGRRTDFLKLLGRRPLRSSIAFVLTKEKELSIVDLPVSAGVGVLSEEIGNWSTALSKDPRWAIASEGIRPGTPTPATVEVGAAEVEAKTAELMESGFDLTKAIFEPLRPHLGGAKSIIVSPQGIFWRVPFQVLPLDVAGSRVVWDDFEVHYVPSISILSQLKVRQGKRKQVEYKGTVLALTNPYFGRRERIAVPDEGVKPLNDPLRIFTALRGTEREGNEIGARVSSGQLVLSDKEATESAFRSRSPRYRVLHLATHAIFLEGAPLQSLIALADPDPAGGENRMRSENDGLLTGREVQQLEFNAQLVVLSACETGKVASSGSEDTLGLLWSFFVSGANMQVVSSWSVDDAASSKLMGAFYSMMYPTKPTSDSERPRPLSPSEALRQASLSVRAIGRDGAQPAWRHPYFWGAFNSVGYDVPLP